jgi:glycosyltransferase involved in cell wall biosynthesis
MVSGIFPPRIGGPATQVSHLCDELTRRGVRVSVVTCGDRNSSEVTAGVRVRRLPRARLCGGRVAALLEFWQVLARLLETDRPDVVHCHDTHLRCLLAGCLARRHGVPAIVKYAGDFVWEYVNARAVRVSTVHEAYRFGVRARLVSALQRWGMRQFTLVQAASQFRRRMLVELVGVRPERIRVIPNFIRLPAWTVARQRGLTDVVGITTGRFAPHKRTMWLIGAFADLERPRALLEIAGGGEADESSAVDRAILASGASSRITRHDSVPYRELVQLLRGASIFVSASIEEGFGISFVEAMACGLPVIATATTAVSEVVPDGDAGFLVPPNERGAFIERWRTLVDDEGLRVRMGERGRIQARRYELSENMGAFLSLYDEAISGGSRGQGWQ